MSAIPGHGPSRRDVLRLLGMGAAAAALPGCSGGASPDAVSWQAIPSYSLQGTDPGAGRLPQGAARRLRVGLRPTG